MRPRTLRAEAVGCRGGATEDQGLGANPGARPPRQTIQPGTRASLLLVRHLLLEAMHLFVASCYYHIQPFFLSFSFVSISDGLQPSSDGLHPTWSILRRYFMAGWMGLDELSIKVMRMSCFGSSSNPILPTCFRLSLVWECESSAVEAKAQICVEKERRDPPFHGTSIPATYSPRRSSNTSSPLVAKSHCRHALDQSIHARMQIPTAHRLLSSLRSQANRLQDVVRKNKLMVSGLCHPSQ